MIRKPVLAVLLLALSLSGAPVAAQSPEMQAATTTGFDRRAAQLVDLLNGEIVFADYFDPSFQAALDLAVNLPDNKKQYHLAEGAGHYGIFNGRKWREVIAPVMETFVRAHDTAKVAPAPLRVVLPPHIEPDVTPGVEVA